MQMQKQSNNFLSFFLSLLQRKKVADVSDPSLIIYYDFDNGPDSDIIPNLGIAGSVADLSNGKIFGTRLYNEAISKELRTPKKGFMVRNFIRDLGSTEYLHLLLLNNL